MMDGRKKELLKNPADKKSSVKNNTYNRKDAIPKSLEKVKEAVSEGFNQFSSELGLNGQQPKEKHTSRNGSSQQENDESLTMSRRSKQVYNDKRAGGKKSENFEKQLSQNLTESPVSKEVKALHRRFDHMEKLLSDSLISANIEYVSHPAFQQLLNTGMQATTISAWFEQVLKKGIDPFEQSQSFMF